MGVDLPEDIRQVAVVFCPTSTLFGKLKGSIVTVKSVEMLKQLFNVQ